LKCHFRCDLTEQNAVVIGSATFLISEVVCNNDHFSRNIISEETSDFVACMSIASTSRPRSQPVLIQFSAKNLSKKGMFGEPQVLQNLPLNCNLSFFHSTIKS
uniref:ZP domain-containing protein n=1 Tax=Anisakis simplex TaxID=6269 RepID=A0A0M3JI76_ANISI